MDGAPVVRKVDCAIHWIVRLVLLNAYVLNSDLSFVEHYPLFVIWQH